MQLVSIIITTKNEEKNIKNCLESIKYQTYPQEKIEIIVVDNNSTDRTKEIAKKYTNKVYNFPDLSHVSRVKNFRGAQLNLGFKKSRGEIIFFPDADMTFDKNLLEESINLIFKDKFQALYIPEVVLGKGFFGKIRNFERSFYNATYIDAVRITTRKIFLKAGGFDEKNISFGPDDWDFTKKVRIVTSKIGITGSKINHHEENMTFGKYLSKKRKYIDTFDGYAQKWGENDIDIRKQLGFSYRLFGVFTENGNWKKLLRQPILAGGMYFLRLIVGTVYLSQKFLKNEKTK